MAYNPEIKSIYEKMNDAQKKQAQELFKNNKEFQSFLSDYQGVSNPQVAQPNPVNTHYGDRGGAHSANSYRGNGVAGSGDYTYNPNLNTTKLQNGGLLFGHQASATESRSPGYLEMRNNAIANALYNEGKTDEDSIRNYLRTFSDFRSYDQLGQENTVQAISKRMGTLQGQGNQTSNFGNLRIGNLSHQPENYQNQGEQRDIREVANTKLQEAYGINSLEELRDRYPEEYENVVKNLTNLEGIWNATDPQNRKLLEGQVQGLLGVGTGIGSERSKLRGLESALLNKFENPEKIKQDAEQISNLQTRGMSTAEIAQKMGMSEDQVHQLVLLANGQESRAGEYYQLKKLEANKITEPFNEKIKRLDEEKQVALERANQNLEWHKQDFDTTMERQKKQNQINAHNADMIAGKYGFGFSKRGIEGLNYVSEQAKNIMDDLVKNYDRGNKEIADGIADIMRNWQWNNKELTKASQEALNQAKNNFTSGVLQIQQKYGILGLQAQQAFSESVQGFISKAEEIYDNALKRQQENLTNLITNASNLNALNVQNLSMRNEKIKQFQQESLGMNREEMFNLAQEIGIQGSYQQLENYQLQSAQNLLNGYASGAGMVFGESVKNLINQGYTAEQAIGAVMQSQEFAQYKNNLESKGDNWAMSNGILYNKATGEMKNAGVGGATGNNKAPTTTKIGDQTVYWDTGSQSWKPITLQSGGANTIATPRNLEEAVGNFASSKPIKSHGGQCGAFVNDYLQSLGLKRLFTDPIKDKKAHINSTTPQVGAIAIMNSPKYPQYGHTAIITAVHEDGRITTLESNQNGDEKVFTRTFLPSKSGKHAVYGYHIPQGKGTPTESNEPRSTNGIPISYEQKIYNLVPTSLKNSDTELKNLYTKSKQLYDAGMSAEEAALTFLGFKVNEENKAFATSLVDHARIGEVNDNFYGVLSDFVNKGKKKEAVKYMEKTLIDNSKNKSNVKESNAIAMIRKIQAFENKIKEAEHKFGPISGRLNSAWTTIRGSDKTQGIKSDLVNMFASIRNEISGASITDSEKAYLSPMIPDLNDKYENVRAKLKSMKENILQDLNGVRQDLNLPLLDEHTLVNTGQRVKLYQETRNEDKEKLGNKRNWNTGRMMNNLIGGLLQNMGRK